MQLKNLLADVAAGLTVSFAAISLGAAFGVMSGRGALAGMIGAAVIPIIASLFGGTRVQASGPTAPMTAVSALIIAYAYDHFPDRMLAEQFITLVFILNAGLLVLAGLFRLGKLISLIPNVIILGFMNGITLLIWFDQGAKLFALKSNPEMHGGIAFNTVIALTTLGFIFFVMWLTKKFHIRPVIKIFLSGVLMSILVMTGVSVLFNFSIERTSLDSSIGSLSEFTSHILRYFPTAEILKWDSILHALPYAAELMLLAYLDSLLTALVVDRMTHEKSNLNRELVAQGLANGAAGICQGIPGAQATIRSVLLIKEGGRSRLAGVLIGVFCIIILGMFMDFINLIPAAVFVGVLLKAGYDVCDKDFLGAYFKLKWFRNRRRNLQLLFIAYTTIVTVLVDLNVAVISGTVLFYISKYFWKVQDVEPGFEEVSEQELKYSSN
jgi:sulfate permease, SulP family